FVPAPGGSLTGMPGGNSASRLGSLIVGSALGEGVLPGAMSHASGIISSQVRGDTAGLSPQSASLHSDPVDGGGGSDTSGVASFSGDGIETSDDLWWFNGASPD